MSRLDVPVRLGLAWRRCDPTVSPSPRRTLVAGRSGLFAFLVPSPKRGIPPLMADRDALLGNADRGRVLSHRESPVRSRTTNAVERQIQFLAERELKEPPEGFAEQVALRLRARTMSLHRATGRRHPREEASSSDLANTLIRRPGSPSSLLDPQGESMGCRGAWNLRSAFFGRYLCARPITTALSVSTPSA